MFSNLILGREQTFAESKYRDKIMERLFSCDGLGLTILRGQLYPSLDCQTHTFRKILYILNLYMKYSRCKFGFNRCFSVSWFYLRCLHNTPSVFLTCETTFECKQRNKTS